MYSIFLPLLVICFFIKNTNVYYYEQYYNEQSLNSGGFVYFCGVNF